VKTTPMRLAISLLLIALTSTVTEAAPASSVSDAADEAARHVAEVCKPVEGKVLSILPDKRFLVDVTAEWGAYVGMELEVFRQGESFKHPVTGETLGRMDRLVGTVRVVEVQPKFSLAEVINLEAGEKVNQGDGVRVTTARLLIGVANITASPGYESVAQRATRDLEVALDRTGRFEVINERRMRSALIKGGLKENIPLRNPDALKLLRQELRLSVVALPHISEADGTLMWDVPIFSPVSGRLLQSVSVAQVSQSESQTPGVAPAAAPTRPRPQAPQVAASEDAPSPAWIGPPSQRSSDFLAVPYAGIPSARLVLGPEFDAALRGIAVADFDGDGRKEVAVAEPGRITIYAIEGKVFRHLWSSKGRDFERGSDILSIDAADINGNGVAEIFVSSYYGGTVDSYVLEFIEGAWVVTWRDVDVLFRVLPDRQGKPTLYGQRAGLETMFTGGVETYRWRDGRYEPASKVKLPKGTYIYNFAAGDVRNDGGSEVIQITDREQRLRVFSGGKLRSEPPDRFGGSGNKFAFEKPEIARNMISYDEHPDFQERYTVHPPLLVADLDGDGKQELVAARNLASSGYTFRSAVVYDQSRIVALRWAGVGFQAMWETQQLEGYVSDFFLGDLGDGGDPVLMFALVRPLQLGLLGEHSGLFLFRLAPAQTQAQTQESK